jgi:pimeloyl-ACP methyl ester carboxylesterase
MKRSLLIAWLTVLGALPMLRADDFKSGDVKIHYTVQGSGSPVLLIHGLHSSGMMNWTLPGTTALVAKNHQVIVMDLRGHGASDKPEDEKFYGVAMVEDVIALMDHLGIKHAHFVGYSMGGMIALKAAVLHPDRVDALLLGGMGWMKDGGELQKFWANVPEKPRLGIGGSCATACMRGMAKLAVTEDQLRALKMPAAIIIGDKDPVKKLYVQPLEAIRPDWPVTTIPGAGHILCVMKPLFRETVANTVDGFAEK